MRGDEDNKKGQSLLDRPNVSGLTTNMSPENLEAFVEAASAFAKSLTDPPQNTHRPTFNVVLGPDSPKPPSRGR